MIAWRPESPNCHTPPLKPDRSQKHKGATPLPPFSMPDVTFLTRCRRKALAPWRDCPVSMPPAAHHAPPICILVTEQMTSEGLSCLDFAPGIPRAVERASMPAPDGIAGAMPDAAMVTVAPSERPAEPPRRTPHRRAAAALIVAFSVHASIAAAMWPLLHTLPEVTPPLTPITILIDQIAVAGASPMAPQGSTDTPPVPSEKAEIDDARQQAVPSRAALAAPTPIASATATDVAGARTVPDSAPLALDKPTDPAPPAPASRRAPSAPPPAPAAAPRPRPSAGVQNNSQGTHARRSASSYPAQVAAHLQRYHSYPREAQASGATGIVRVSFQLDRAGRVRSVALSQQSSSAMLNTAALSAVRRASPFPAPPADAGSLNFQVPLRFVMR